MFTASNFIPGASVAAASQIEFRRPQDGTVIGRIDEAGKAGVDAAVISAGEAFRRHRKVPLAKLGSNAANIVLADADLALAASRIASAGFEASGQQCISAQRVIVEPKVFAAFLEACVAAAKKLKVGDRNDPATAVGPMVNRAAADRVEQMIADAV